MPGYVRYMDDFVLFDGSKGALRAALQGVSELVEGELRLQLKERATILAPAHQGLPFLGWRLYRGTRRVRPENARRTRRRLRHRRWELRRGRIGPGRYLAAVTSVLRQTSSCQVGADESEQARRARLLGLCLSEDEWVKAQGGPRTG